MRPTCYRSCWHVVGWRFLARYRQARPKARGSSRATGVYNPKAVILHAASHGQGFPHCQISSTAAARRRLGSVSVPVWPTILSDRLPIVALVSHYPTNKLIGRGPLPWRLAPLNAAPCEMAFPFGISVRFQTLFPTSGQVTHVLLTLSPLTSGCPEVRSTCMPNPRRQRSF